MTSQMTPEVSISALMRAKKDVAGDTNQLPLLFQERFSDDDADEDIETRKIIWN